MNSCKRRDCTSLHLLGKRMDDPHLYLDRRRSVKRWWWIRKMRILNGEKTQEQDTSFEITKTITTPHKTRLAV
jgi:hypothetical protein